MSEPPTRVYLLMGMPARPVDAAAADDLARQQLLSTECCKTNSIENVRIVVERCYAGAEASVLPISLENLSETMADLAKKQASGERLAVFNLCDGTETDGYPGISVVQQLQKLKIPFTGADADFFEGTTSKPVLKQKLVAHGVPTSPFVEIRPGSEEEDMKRCEEIIKDWPMIIKPAVSYASISISHKSVVSDRKEAIAQARTVLNTTHGGVFVESFLNGREFTALCTGDAASSESSVTVYPVAERVFNAELKQEERFLAFDRYWDGYSLDEPMPTTDKPPFYWYAKAPEEWQSILQDIARRAYIACGGNGYGRVDIRTRSVDKPDAFVLEVNANCGLSFDAGTSSVAEILLLADVDPVEFCRGLIGYAMTRKLG